MTPSSGWALPPQTLAGMGRLAHLQLGEGFDQSRSADREAQGQWDARSTPSLRRFGSSITQHGTAGVPGRGGPAGRASHDGSDRRGGAFTGMSTSSGRVSVVGWGPRARVTTGDQGEDVYDASLHKNPMNEATVRLGRHGLFVPDSGLRKGYAEGGSPLHPFVHGKMKSQGMNYGLGGGESGVSGKGGEGGEGRALDRWERSTTGAQLMPKLSSAVSLPRRDGAVSVPVGERDEHGVMPQDRREVGVTGGGGRGGSQQVGELGAVGREVTEKVGQGDTHAGQQGGISLAEWREDPDRRNEREGGERRGIDVERLLRESRISHAAYQLFHALTKVVLSTRGTLGSGGTSKGVLDAMLRKAGRNHRSYEYEAALEEVWAVLLNACGGREVLAGDLPGLLGVYVHPADLPLDLYQLSRPFGVDSAKGHEVLVGSADTGGGGFSEAKWRRRMERREREEERLRGGWDGGRQGEVGRGEGGEVYGSASLREMKKAKQAREQAGLDALSAHRVVIPEMRARLEWRQHQERIIQGSYVAPLIESGPMLGRFQSGPGTGGLSEARSGAGGAGNWYERRSWDGVYAKDEARKLGAEAMRGLTRHQYPPTE